MKNNLLSQLNINRNFFLFFLKMMIKNGLFKGRWVIRATKMMKTNVKDVIQRSINFKKTKFEDKSTT